MTNQTISRENLKAIYDIACSGWKTKLEGFAKRNPFSDVIIVSQAEVDEMFKASDPSQIKVLKKFFSIPLDIRSRVKSFKDACSVLGLDFRTVFSPDDDKSDIAFKKLKIIIKALNEGWYPNWENENETKYYNYFRMKGGFSYWITASSHFTTTDVPSALCLRSNELAVHAAEIALEEYQAYYS